MAFNIHNRSLLSLMHHSERELQYLLDLSRDLKRAKYSTERQHLKGKNIALIFEKTSTRTRCAFEVAAYDQGANVTYIDLLADRPQGKHEGHRAGARTAVRRHRIPWLQAGDRRGAGALRRPVYNGLTDEYHPTQMIADVDHARAQRQAAAPDQLRLSGRCAQGNSLLLIGAKLGMDVRIAAPRAGGEQHGLRGSPRRAVRACCSPRIAQAAVQGVDFIHTDVWVSMGEPMDAWAERIQQLLPYR